MPYATIGKTRPCNAALHAFASTCMRYMHACWDSIVDRYVVLNISSWLSRLFLYKKMPGCVDVVRKSFNLVHTFVMEHQLVHGAYHPAQPKAKIDVHKLGALSIN